MSSSRQSQFAREDFARAIAMEGKVRAGLGFDERAEKKRRGREIREKEEEQEKREKEEKERVTRDVKAREELIAEQERIRIEVMQTERLREEKVRQAIRENSPELKELQRKLAEAKTSKTRTVQMAEKIRDKERDKAYEAFHAAQVQASIDEQIKIDEKRSVNEYAKMQQYNQSLNTQLQEQEQARQMEYEDFLREKEKIDAIVQKIIVEDQKQATARLQKQTELRSYINSFVEDRAQWQQRENARIAEENRRIEEYSRAQAERSHEIAVRKQENSAAKDQLYNKLVDTMQNAEKEKAEFEDLRIELALAEEEEKLREQEKVNLANRIKRRLEMLDAYREQILSKKRKQIADDEEEASYRSRLMLKFAEEDKLEQLADQKRRLKQQEHKHAVESMIMERRQRAIIERQEEADQNARLAEVERFRMEVIEQERQRLLREHAHGLSGPLPKGVLRDDKDLAVFENEFRKFQISGV